MGPPSVSPEQGRDDDRRDESKGARHRNPAPVTAQAPTRSHVDLPRECRWTRLAQGKRPPDRSGFSLAGGRLWIVGRRDREPRRRRGNGILTAPGHGGVRAALRIRPASRSLAPPAPPRGAFHGRPIPRRRPFAPPRDVPLRGRSARPEKRRARARLKVLSWIRRSRVMVNEPSTPAPRHASAAGPAGGAPPHAACSWSARSAAWCSAMSAWTSSSSASPARTSSRR